MDIADKIRAGARWLGAAKFVTQIYTWVLTVMTMRLLAPEDYAIMSMAGVFLAFIVQFEELGLRVKLVQMKDYTVEYARSVYGLVLVTNFALVLALSLASPFIAAFFKQSILVPIIITLSVSMMISALGSIPDALIKRQLDFRSLAIIDVVRAVTASTATFVLASLGFGVWSLVGSAVIGSVVGTLGLVLVSPFRSAPSFNFKGMGDTLQFGGLVMLQRLVWWAYSGLDSLLIGRFYPAASLGIYSTAGTLATLPIEKVGSILNVLSFTGLSRVNQDLEMFRHYLRRATKLVALILFPTFFGIAAIANEFAPVLLGERWNGLGTIAAILALSAPARCISSVVTESLNSLGKPELHLRCMLVTAGLFAAGIVAGLPIGLHAIAAGVVAASLLACLHNANLVCKQVEMPLSRLLVGMWQPTAAGLIMLVVISLLRPLLPIEFPSAAGLGVTIAMGALIYAGLIAAFDRDGFRLVLALAKRG
ncbi:MAG: lipopolysaccharide biosynthesis protein [Alphaproteobacteria bacterium]|nr:lipopolysaccharide biosynthesis protein [Alphaproteobacteria bacterium]